MNESEMANEAASADQREAESGPKFTLEEVSSSRLRVKVIGIGGCGSNVVDSIVASGVQTVELVALNTDRQALEASRAPVKLEIGARLTMGHGTGSNPDLGRQAALDDTEELGSLLSETDIVFLIAGMGGGTGTGATPVIASLAKQLSVLTIAFVVTPFEFEGHRRQQIAEDGLQSVVEQADTGITVPNDRLLDWVDAETEVSDGFRIAHRVIERVLTSVTAILNSRGILNVDFAHIQQIFQDGGTSIVGYGAATGSDAAVKAVRAAMAHPLMAVDSLSAASNVLVNLRVPKGFGMLDCTEALRIVQAEALADANLLVGIIASGAEDGAVEALLVGSGVHSDDFGMRVQSVDSASPDETDGERDWRSELAIELGATTQGEVPDTVPVPTVGDGVAPEPTIQQSAPPDTAPPPAPEPRDEREYMPPPQELGGDDTVSDRSPRKGSFFGRRLIFPRSSDR